MQEIEKEIDDLGRVVLPASLRQRLGLKSRSKVLITIEDGRLTLSPKEVCCALCGKRVNACEKFRLCAACLAEIRAKKP